MELYIYESPLGRIADFRPYLDGKDHSFDDHRDLAPVDPRWEKIRALRHPVRLTSIGGQLRFVGKSEMRWRELILFPIVWEGPFEPVDWQ
jgi:hypothetical protein